MRNIIIFVIICSVIVVAIVIGANSNSLTTRKQDNNNNTNSFKEVPHIGRLEVLNGCGEKKAASKVADYLRNNNFDVIEIGNADNWNYEFTIVVSHKNDMTIAKKICKALNTDKLILLRDDDTDYDISVIVGADYTGLIK